MTTPETIIRVAAKGDGITQNGTHVAGAAPGDTIADGKIVERGPHYQSPPCQHYARCGGCQLQHLDDDALAEFVRDRVVNAAEGQGITAEKLLPTHLSPPATRRRATLHALRVGKRAVVGYREAGSHKVVDLKECPVLHPDLAALVPALRDFIAKHGSKGAVDIALAFSDQGVDCSLSNLALEGLAATEAALDFARDNSLARLSIDQGYGPETVWEPEPVTVTLGGVPVSMPTGAFLQATADAESRMIEDARDYLGDAKIIADLFSGLGTFAFALAEGRKVLAAEAEQSTYLACKSSANVTRKPVHCIHRDLFRNPVTAAELSRFDAVLLDPPRAGARDQIAQAAQSELKRVIYVSCNPSSWARDAKVLVEAGFSLKKLRPVGQFRWSNHVELTSLFER